MRLCMLKENCCGCAACAEKCPQEAVRMIQDREGFYYPKIDQSICNDCGMCEQVCPLNNQAVENSNNLYLGMKAKDDGLRFAGSSGGSFGILARYIIKKGGAVYGAGYDSHMSVVHKGVDDLTHLEGLRKTKYVQSDMRGVYRQIEERLRDGKWVLFCGTPCQARALMLFLKKEYERLIVVDFVCYGVPSPGVWRDYVKYLEKLRKGKMTDFQFRDKRNVDNGHARSYRIDEKEYVDSIYDDFFCKLYFRNIIIRPSCHQCVFCTTDRSSDFTIGDFWGVEQIRPDLDDGMGISMMIVHTDKAKRIWNEIREETCWFECLRRDLIQPRLLSPTDASKSRWKFMMLYKILPFFALMRLMNR